MRWWELLTPEVSQFFLKKDPLLLHLLGSSSHITAYFVMRCLLSIKHYFDELILLIDTIFRTQLAIRLIKSRSVLELSQEKKFKRNRIFSFLSADYYYKTSPYLVLNQFVLIWVLECFFIFPFNLTDVKGQKNRLVDK